MFQDCSRVVEDDVVAFRKLLRDTFARCLGDFDARCTISIEKTLHDFDSSATAPLLDKIAELADSAALNPAGKERCSTWRWFWQASPTMKGPLDETVSQELFTETFEQDQW